MNRISLAPLANRTWITGIPVGLPPSALMLGGEGKKREREREYASLTDQNSVHQQPQDRYDQTLIMQAISSKILIIAFVTLCVKAPRRS